MCRQIQPLWSQIAGRYSHLGVIFGIANIQDDHALREELNVLHSPSIVAVLDGKVSYFMRSEFTEEAIIDYLVQALLNTGPLRSSPLPGLPSTTLGTPLMKTVSSEAELNAFHAGWLEDSRPRALFVKAASRPPLRFCLAAFRAADFHASGFVDTQNSITEPITQRLNLSRDKVSPKFFTVILIIELCEEVQANGANQSAFCYWQIYLNLQSDHWCFRIPNRWGY